MPALKTGASFSSARSAGAGLFVRFRTEPELNGPASVRLT